MLKQLLIKNYVLIEALEIAPSSHLNIITGETGAGKSILLGALGLLMGKRAETNVLYDPEQKCVVEGNFALASHEGMVSLFEKMGLDYEDSTIIRREIAPNGKSRAFINDTPVTLEDLRKVGIRLMDIHSQHDTQLLGSEAFQLRIVDAYAQNQALASEYSIAYRSLVQATQALEKLQQESQSASKEYEYNLYQLNELDAAKLDGLDQPALEEELETLENAEQIKNTLNLSIDALSGAEYAVLNMLKRVEGALGQIASFGAKFGNFRERLAEARINLSELNLDIEREESDLFFDEARIQALQERLERLYMLQKKHQVEDLESLLAIREALREKVEKVLHFEEDLKRLQQAKEEAFRKTMEAGGRLSATRLEAIPKIEAELARLLADVGIPNGRVSIDQDASTPQPSGIDSISLLFSANKGIDPAPLKNVASGGEFSRLMLCIKYVLASKVSLPTIIFDEIDTGVSGEVAIKVGQMMEEMAKQRQLIAITHLPQIASKGDAHYFVYKDDTSDRTISRIRKLSRDERIASIAEMIGGSKPSPIAFENAKELLGMSS